MLGKGVDNALTAVDNFVETPIPQAHFSQNIQNPIGRFFASIPEGIINTPATAQHGLIDLGHGLGTGTLTPQRTIGDVAEMAQLPLLLYGGGAASSIGRLGLKESLLRGATSGAKVGGAFGGLQGLSDNRNAPTVNEQFAKSLPYVGTGALLGAGLGAGGAGLLKGGQYLTPKAQQSVYESMLNARVQPGGLEAGFIGGSKAKGFADTTGQFSNLADKKVRFELSDKGARVDVSKIGYKTNLADIIDHPTLFKNYPELRNMKVTKTAESNSSFDGKEITIGAYDKSPKKALLHEIQHAIQAKEDFARGGTPSTVSGHKMIPVDRGIVDIMFQHKPGARVYLENGGSVTKDRINLVSPDQKLFLKEPDVMAYQRLAGEIEARSVAGRSPLSQKQLMSSDPYAGQNIPTKDWITQFGDEGVAGQLDPRIIKFGKNEVSWGREDMVARERFNIPLLKKVSQGGSDRDVYDLGNGKVLKVAKTARGFAQNQAEGEPYAPVPKSFEAGKNYVVVEKALPPDANVKAMIKELKANINPFMINDERLKYGEIDKFVAIVDKYGLTGDDFRNFDPMWNDLMAIRNWGTHKDGTPVLIDAGSLNVRLLKEYRGKTNMSDPEFSSAYNQSRAAKKQFGDTDPATMYSIDPNAIKRVISGAGQLKEKKLVTRMKGSDKYPANLRKMLEGRYVGITNDATKADAKRLVYLDPNAAEQRALNPQNAVDQAIGAELFNYHMEKGNVAKANEIINASSGTNEGQMIQILASYDKTTPSGAIRFANNAIKGYNETHPNSPLKLTDPQIKGFYAKAQKIQKMKAGRERNIASNDLINEINNLIPSSVVDKGIAVWKAGLLTSLRTQERNLFGNSVQALAETAKDIPASIADQVMSLATGKRSMTFTTKGSGAGTVKGLSAAKDMLARGYDPEESIAKYDVRHITWGNNPIEQGLKHYTNVVFRTLGASDKPFWNAAFARSLYDQAGAEAINAGKRGDKAFIENLVKSPPEKMKLTAIKDANMATFKDETVMGNIAKAIKHEAGKNEVSKAIAEVVAPFTGVPTSFANQIIEYSPVGLIKGIARAGRVIVKNIPEAQRAAAQEIGRGTIGTGLIAVGSYLMQQGLMTGNPKDAAEARQWTLERKQANSILVDGEWRSLNSISPAFLILLAGAKYQEAQKKNEGAISTVGNTAAQMLKDYVQQPLLQGVNQPIAVITDPQQNKPERYFGSLAASNIPNLVKDTAKANDSWTRENNTLGDYVQNAIPGWRNQNIVSRDALGNQIPNQSAGIDSFIDLFNSKKPVTGDPVINELSRLNGAGYNSTPGKIGASQTINGGKMKLTPEQVDTLEGQVGGQAREALSQLIQADGYKALSDEDKAKAVDSVMTAVRKQVRGNIDINGGGATGGGQPTQQSGQQYTLVDEKGNVKQINLSKQIAAPTLTNNYELDKALISKYNSALSARKSDIIALFEAKKISSADAEKALQGLKASKLGGTGRKKVARLKAPKIKIRKLAKVKTSKIKKVKRYNLAKAKITVKRLSA